MDLSSWDSYYSEQWKGRWPALKQSLLLPNRYVARRNAFCELGSSLGSVLSQEPIPKLSISCYPLEEVSDPPLDTHGLKGFYAMDLASLFPVLALEIESEDRVLDMCAAPGGKALMIVEQSRKPEQIYLNEPSRARRDRLKKVLREYLPAEIREKLNLKGIDGARIGLKDKEAFNKILIDAPCSGERHLIRDPKVMGKWSPARSKNLSQRQYALLASAWASLAPGGKMVYSTCSISKMENDQIISRLINKKKGKLRVVQKQWAYGEATEHGWQILPDRDEAWGPIYFSILSKEHVVAST